MMGMKPRDTDSRTLTSTLAISNLELSTQAAVFQPYFLEHWGSQGYLGLQTIEHLWKGERRREREERA